MVVHGQPEEHYLTKLHVRKADAETIAAALASYMSDHNLDFRKLVGKGNDGAATFSGKKSGVQKRVCVHAAYALYIHCSCHRLQLWTHRSCVLHVLQGLGLFGRIIQELP